MIEVKNLSYAIKGKNILEDVSFKVEKGALMGLMGPNGSGKTTLIKILSGMIKDYSGLSLINGMHINKMKPKGLARLLAVVTQDQPISFPFTALEIVLMGRFVHKRPFSFQSAEDLIMANTCMEKTGCTHLSHRPIDTLSGGERQRVFLACALAQKTEVLLLDEPLTHLDLKGEIEFFETVRQLHREGMTIICVVHDLGRAARLFSHLVLLKGGKVMAHGKTKEALTPSNIEKIYEVDFNQLSQLGVNF